MNAFNFRWFSPQYSSGDLPLRFERFGARSLSDSESDRPRRRGFCWAASRSAILCCIAWKSVAPVVTTGAGISAAASEALFAEVLLPLSAGARAGVLRPTLRVLAGILDDAKESRRAGVSLGEVLMFSLA